MAKEFLAKGVRFKLGRMIPLLITLMATFGCSPKTPEEQAKWSAELKADHERRMKEMDAKAKRETAEFEERKRKMLDDHSALIAKEADRKAHGDKTDAYIAAQDFVRQNLTFPDKGFAWKSTQVKDQGNGAWFISSYVDTTNAFKKEIRLYFNANVTFTGNGRWNLDTLDVWEEGQAMRKIK